MSYWKNVEEVENVECTAKITDLRLMQASFSEHDLVKYLVENNKLNPNSKIIEVETDKAVFALCYKAQKDKFKNLYSGKTMVYVKINAKGFMELCLTQTEIDVVKKNLGQK